MDAFAITIANCATYKDTLNRKKEWAMPVAFAIFQILMPIIGYYIGSLFADYISSAAKYVTAAIFFALATKIVSTTYPPQEALYQQNPLLPPGTVQELKKARTGYVVETYRVYQRNGAEYKRELLCTSTYKMIQQVIEYN